MQPSTKFEKELERMILRETANVYPSEDMFRRIEQKISEEGNCNMKTGTIKRSKLLLAACLVLVFTTVTCFAASKIASYTVVGTNDTFKTYPAEEQVKEKAGFLPKYLESFSNGYQFKNAGVGETTAMDEEGNKIGTVPMISFTYKNGDSIVSLNVDNSGQTDMDEDPNASVIMAGNTKIHYSEYMNKILPPDYEMTEQDKKDEAEGTYVFSYGSEKVEISHIQSLVWVENGMTYYLGCFDDGVDQKELIEMAKEIMNK